MQKSLINRLTKTAPHNIDTKASYVLFSENIISSLWICSKKSMEKMSKVTLAKCVCLIAHHTKINSHLESAASAAQFVLKIIEMNNCSTELKKLNISLVLNFSNISAIVLFLNIHDLSSYCRYFFYMKRIRKKVSFIYTSVNRIYFLHKHWSIM